LEALAEVETIMHFSHYLLYGKMFSVYTYHRLLYHLMNSTKNGKLHRYAMKLQPWLVVIQYVIGEWNTMPDTLSRQEWNRQTDWLAEDTDLQQEKHRSGEEGRGGSAPQSFKDIRPQERAEEVQLQEDEQTRKQR